MIFRTSMIPATDNTGTRVCVKFFDGVDDQVEFVAWDYSSYDAHFTAAVDVARRWGVAKKFESWESMSYGKDHIGGVLIVQWHPYWE
jgi:hypothetical protein